jgi:putative peptidoglycan lipid II flippase
MLVAAWFFSEAGIISLLIGMFVGYLLAGLVQAAIVIKEQWSFGIAINFQSKQFRHALRLWVPFGVGSLVSSSSYVIDRIMISLLGDGEMAVFGYTNVLLANLINIFLISFSTALLPILSMLPTGQKNRFAEVVGDSLCLSMFVLLPLAGLVAVYSDLLINIIYQRGQFTLDDHANVSALLTVYIFKIFPLASVMLFARTLNALLDAKTKVIAAIISASLNLSLNYLLMQWIGIIGIALSTVITHTVVTGYFLVMLRVKHNFILPDFVIKRLVKVVVLTGIGMTVGGMILHINVWVSIIFALFAMIAVAKLSHMEEYLWVVRKVQKSFAVSGV